jgi:hypothetical protein
MKARIQLGLLKLTDPRVVRVLLVGLTLVLMLLAGGSLVYADSPIWRWRRLGRPVKRNLVSQTSYLTLSSRAR